jgi:hypothetical protein
MYLSCASMCASKPVSCGDFLCRERRVTGLRRAGLDARAARMQVQSWRRAPAAPPEAECTPSRGPESIRPFRRLAPRRARATLHPRFTVKLSASSSACPGPSASGLRLSQASALLRHCVLRTHLPDQRNHWLASGAIDFHTEYPRLPTASQTAGTCDRFRESLRDWRMRSVARATWHAREDMASPRSSGGASGKEGAHADSSSVGAPGA